MIRLGRYQFSLEGIALGVVVAGLLMGGLTCRRTPPSGVDAALRVELDSLRKLSAKVDTVRVAQTDSFTRWRTKYDTVRTTLNIHDTIEVIRFVYVADSTIRACSLALASCEESRRLLGEQVNRLNLRISALAPPSRWEVAGDRAKWAAIGYGVGKVIEAFLPE